MIVCTCLNPEPHVIARSETFDGVALELWSDGDITGRLGWFPKGMARNRDPEVATRAANRIWHNICLYSMAELPGKIRLERAIARLEISRRTA